MVVLLGFASLTIDAGLIYNTRTELQDAADSSRASATRDKLTGLLDKILEERDQVILG